MKKTLLSIIVIVVILFGTVLLTKDMLAKAALIKGIKAAAGLEVSTRSVHIGILRSVAGIEGLKISNPSGFSDAFLADIPEIYVDYDLPSLFKKKVHLKELRINIQELLVSQGKDRKFNVSRLTLLMPKPSGAEPPQINIDELVLKVGKVVYKDYAQEPGPKILEYNLNIDERFSNVTDPSKLAGQVIVKILARVNITDFLNVNLKPVKEQFSQGLQQGQALVSEATGTAKQSVGELQGTTKETIDAAKGNFKKLLGQ